MKELTDHELAKLLKSDSHQAFTEIYNRYWTSLFLIAYNRLKDKSISEEIIQTVFMNLWNRRGRLHIDSSLAPYLAKAVKFEVINYYIRSEHRENYLTWLSNYRVGVASIEDIVHAKMIQEFVDKSVANLPERCRLVFKLRVDEGYSQKEIAEELKISEKTVEAQLTKARKHLKSVLGASGIIEALLIFLKL